MPGSSSGSSVPPGQEQHRLAPAAGDLCAARDLIPDSDGFYDLRTFNGRLVVPARGGL